METRTKNYRDQYAKDLRYFRTVFVKQGARAFQKAIKNAWDQPIWERGGSLFKWCSVSGRSEPTEQHMCGCLTQVRAYKQGRFGGVRQIFEATKPEWTNQIRQDTRLAKNPKDIIHPDQLRVFAQYQRMFRKG